MVNSIIAQESTDCQEILGDFPPGTRLSEIQSDAFQAYMQMFVRYFPKKSYHVKRSYQPGKDGFIQTKSKKGKTLPLFDSGDYTALTDAVERHLDSHLWSEFKAAQTFDPETYRRIRHDVERFYWLGLHAPQKVSHETIDLDNSYLADEARTGKRIIGYRRLGRDELQPVLPVVHLPLVHFQRLKAVYDTFPNRIWCISSETLGLNAWALYTRAMPLDQMRSWVLHRLSHIGVQAEVHPMPGRCQRRPFGKHYRTITAAGVLTDWIEQLAYFQRPGPTPTFERIANVLLAAMLRQWHDWITYGDALDKTVNPRRIVTKYRPEVAEVQTWLADGCPSSHAAVSIPITQPKKNKSLSSPATDFDKEIQAACQNGRWVQFLEKLATDGLPAKKSLFGVCRQLCSWLYWVEMYHVPANQRRQRVIRLFLRYVEAKHNGNCSRMVDGDERSHRRVQQQVERQVDWVINHGDQKVFSDLRYKRASGKYRKLIELVPILACQSNLIPSLLPLVYSVSTSPPVQTDVKMVLPKEIDAAISKVYHDKRYKGKLLSFAAKLLTHLYEQGGECTISQERLGEFLGYHNPTRINKYKNILVKAGVLKQGGYRAHSKCRRYVLLMKAAFDLQKGIAVAKTS